MTGHGLRMTAAAALVGLAGAAQAAQCGNTAAGFEAWKDEFIAEAKGRASPSALAALANTSYSTATISAAKNR